MPVRSRVTTLWRSVSPRLLEWGRVERWGRQGGVERLYLLVPLRSSRGSPSVDNPHQRHSTSLCLSPYVEWLRQLGDKMTNSMWVTFKNPMLLFCASRPIPFLPHTVSLYRITVPLLWSRSSLTAKIGLKLYFPYKPVPLSFATGPSFSSHGPFPVSTRHLLNGRMRLKREKRIGDGSAFLNRLLCFFMRKWMNWNWPRGRSCRKDEL